MDDLNSPIFDVRSKMVESHGEMLGTWADFVVCGNFDAGFIVLKSLALDGWSRGGYVKPTTSKFVKRFIMEITSRRAVERLIYSASVVDSAISCWRLEAQ